MIKYKDIVLSSLEPLTDVLWLKKDNGKYTLMIYNQGWKQVAGETEDPVNEELRNSINDLAKKMEDANKNTASSVSSINKEIDNINKSINTINSSITDINTKLNESKWRIV